MVSLNWWDIEIIEKANERIYQERESKKKKRLYNKCRCETFDI